MPSIQSIKKIVVFRIILTEKRKKFITGPFITMNVYSILYNNSEIWHLSGLKINLKQKVLSVSAKAIKTCMSVFKH